jgi:hypothetical protein
VTHLLIVEGSLVGGDHVEGFTASRVERRSGRGSGNGHAESLRQGRYDGHTVDRARAQMRARPLCEALSSEGGVECTRCIDDRVGH